MATSPAYAATPRCGSAVCSATADTSYTAPTNVATVLTAGASGSKIDEIRFQGTGTTLSGVINVFAYDGSTYHLIDSINVPGVTASTTAASWNYPKPYTNFVLPNGWSLRVTSTVASQLVNVTAFGGDF